MHATLPLLKATQFPAISRRALSTLQVNLGYQCNQSCLHCHVNAGPHRTEMMAPENLELVLQVIQARAIGTLDLTGGAPELHPQFRDLVRRARALGVRVIDRCNLTILQEPGQEGLARFLADEAVQVLASLPCYTPGPVDQQRGQGVFARSISGLQTLNALGYGQANGALQLHLVYNPQGPTLPPEQAQLQATYQRELWQNFGIVFNQLYALVNMPIQRFGSQLISKGQFHDYLRLLQDNFQASHLDGLMCRSLISVDWQGRLFDCDFNQQLGLPMPMPIPGPEPKRPHLRDLLTTDPDGLPIQVAAHCYGCTAGQGSSCGGALKV